MGKSLRIVWLAAFLSVSFLTYGQTGTPLDQTLLNLQKRASETPFEKAYLHTDKPFYAAGDTIWFKAYVLTGQQHRLTAISDLLNVDLINRNDMIIRSLKLPMIAGMAYGDFALPDTLDEGSYRIRAYTNWMRNSGQEYFFDKTYTIVNAVKTKVFTNATYTYTKQNGQQNTTVNIRYADLQGKPYVNRDVKYDVILDNAHITKGSATTDDNGNIHLDFINSSPQGGNDGEINTTIYTSNEPVNKVIAIQATSAAVDVQFFPESGNLINGVTSKVAFKAVGADGLGADIKGTITDEKNQTVTSFNSVHLGMGMFELTPQTGKTYKAQITFADGSQNTVNLPKSLDRGYVMTVNNTDTTNKVTVQINGTATSPGEILTLIAQAGGDIYFAGRSKPGQNSFAAVIPKSKFPSGIVQFTLFSGAGEPLNERLVFINNPDKLNVAVKSDKLVYTPDGKVQLDIRSSNASVQPVQGNFSIAVINESVVPVDENNESTILSNILLTSDLKGYIEQPNYYFAHPDNATAAALDVLMLTQGYRRFEWKTLSANAPNDIMYQPEKSLTISGTIKTRAGKPSPNAKVILISTARGAFFADTVADKNGRFVFVIDFPDSTVFAVKALNANGGRAVVIDMDKSPQVISRNKNTADIAVNVNKGLQSYLENSRRQYDDDVKNDIGGRTIMLKAVEISRMKKSTRQIAQENAVKYSANLNGPGVANQVVTAEELDHLGGGTLYQKLAGVLSGVDIRFDIKSGAVAAYLNRAGAQFMNDSAGALPMAVIIDGTFNRNLDDIPVTSISSIEVLRSVQYLGIYGSRGSAGVLVITTKHGGQETFGVEGSMADPNVINNYMPKGYYRALTFYSPRYDSPQPVKKAADLRSTIYWNPFVETDKNGNATVDFFNADTKGTYRVVIEGVDYKNGTLGRQVYRYKVE